MVRVYSRLMASGCARLMEARWNGWNSRLRDEKRGEAEEAWALTLKAQTQLCRKITHLVLLMVSVLCGAPAQMSLGHCHVNEGIGGMVFQRTGVGGKAASDALGFRLSRSSFSNESGR